MASTEFLRNLLKIHWKFIAASIIKSAGRRMRVKKIEVSRSGKEEWR
jgi:hypothetical protein